LFDGKMAGGKRCKEIACGKMADGKDIGR